MQGSEPRVAVISPGFDGALSQHGAEKGLQGTGAEAERPMGSHCECPGLGGVLRPAGGGRDCGRRWNPKEEPTDLTTECGGRGRVSQEEPQVPGLGNLKEELSLQTD